MRQLVVFQGASSDARAREISDAGLTPFTLDIEALRTMLGDCAPARDGWVADPHTDKSVRRHIMHIITDKFIRGATVVISTGPDGFLPLGRLAEEAARYRYTGLLVQLDATPPEPRGLSGITRLHAPTDPQWRAHLACHLSAPRIDMDRYAHIVIIGDLHGAERTFRAMTDDRGPRADTGYVFLGDYITKGPRSGELLSLLHARFGGHDGTLFLAGNHETALESWIRGEKRLPAPFLKTALPSLKRAGVGKTMAREFLERTVDGAWITWRGQRILATHGGLDHPPDALGLLSAACLRHGTGVAESDVDSCWESGVRDGTIAPPDRLFQVHGHRNPHGSPIAAGIGSYNLEGGIDSGGAIRALVLSADGETRSLAFPDKDGIGLRAG